MLKELWKYSIQEIADKMTLHLLQQGKVSRVAAGSSCLYRGPNGLKCAVGILIEDEDYDPEMELQGTTFIIEKFFPESYFKTDIIILQMISDFQTLHDIEVPSRWKEAILKIYTQYNINPENIL